MAHSWLAEDQTRRREGTARRWQTTDSRHDDDGLSGRNYEERVEGVSISMA
jgi:hypothetical protein